MKCEFCNEEIKPRQMTEWKTCCIASFIRQQIEDKTTMREIIKYLEKK